jgi:hypothetical protein
MRTEPVSPQCLRSVFDETVAGTVGLEEELLLVRRGTWRPAHRRALCQCG